MTYDDGEDDDDEGEDDKDGLPLHCCCIVVGVSRSVASYGTEKSGESPRHGRHSQQ